jgi:3-carboxy-cis,cis-muconate cycloisomerase
MSLYSRTFYADELSELFSDQENVANLLRVEAALAMSQARVGLVPDSAARIIAECCRLEAIDLHSLKSDVVLGGNVAIPLVKQLTKVIKNRDFEASKYLHLGATSQDIIDTATVLMIKAYVEWLEAKLLRLEQLLFAITKDHLHTLMIGRTLLQQAKPMTFGVKTAGWLLACSRNLLRLRQMKSHLFHIQLGGAVGSGNSDITWEVQEVMADLLGLSPSFPWQSQRDTFAEFASFLGTLSGSLGKIAKDVSLLMQTEVAEVYEGAGEGKGGSSTLPHKRNPVGCALILSNATRTPGLVATMLSAMPQDHERSAGMWHAEWETLADLMRLVGGSVEKSLDLITNLEVDKVRMLQNIELTNGLIYAEKISLHLSKSLGKMQAHESVKKACSLAILQQKHLKQVIAELHPQLENLDDLFQPQQAIGQSVAWVENVLKSYT